MELDFVARQARAWIQYRAQSPHEESVNGPGSTLGATEYLREWLPDVFASYEIKTMLDAPCGDTNWMRRVDLGDVRYVGWDVDPILIVQNSDSPEWQGRATFQSVSLLEVEAVPCFDLIFCRDFFQHLPNEAIVEVLGKFVVSGSSYLITNHYVRSNNWNHDCPLDSGHYGAINKNELLPGYYYRPVNIEQTPFSLKGRLESIVEPVLEEEDFSNYIQEMVLFDLEAMRPKGE